MAPNLQIDENYQSEQEKIISLFGTVEYEPDYDYKKQRNRHKYNGRQINKAGNQVNQVLLK